MAAVIGAIFGGAVAFFVMMGVGALIMYGHYTEAIDVCEEFDEKGYVTEVTGGYWKMFNGDICMMYMEDGTVIPSREFRQKISSDNSEEYLTRHLKRKGVE